MKKLILIAILCLFAFPAHASIMGELRYHNLKSSEFHNYYHTPNAAACTYEGDIYIDEEKTKAIGFYQHAIMHEIAHNLFTPYRSKYKGADEEMICDAFAIFVLEGIDTSGGLFHEMIINGIK
jgi:hypothetical protein